MLHSICRFCLGNNLLIDTPLVIMKHLFVLGSIEKDRPHQAMIVPHRHVETPYELNGDEWSEIGTALEFVKGQFSNSDVDGYTVGWNVGEVAGQDVFHAHLHVIARFSGEPSEGFGIRALIKARR
ncbi:MAG: HIT domain-containing protein [Paracoccaceae bacterium]|nr:HIT domain-containing protein [Paracoccaceae bacterium]